MKLVPCWYSLRQECPLKNRDGTVLFPFFFFNLHRMQDMHCTKCQFKLCMYNVNILLQFHKCDYVETQQTLDKTTIFMDNTFLSSVLSFYPLVFVISFLILLSFLFLSSCPFFSILMFFLFYPLVLTFFILLSFFYPLVLHFFYPLSFSFLTSC